MFISVLKEEVGNSYNNDYGFLTVVVTSDVKLISSSQQYGLRGLGDRQAAGVFRLLLSKPQEWPACVSPGRNGYAPRARLAVVGAVGLGRGLSGVGRKGQVPSSKDRGEVASLSGW